MSFSPWVRTMKARALVRLWSIFGEPLWIVVSMGFPVLSSLALSLLYYSIGATGYIGFAVLGGVMVSFWGNVLWSMASQFYWDKQEGLFEIYLTSPASITAILIGMSVGGIIGTVPSAIIVSALGWVLFHPVRDFTKQTESANSLKIQRVAVLVTLERKLPRWMLGSAPTCHNV